MKCDVCKKNPAQLHVTRIINGKAFGIHVCPQCAKDKGLQDLTHPLPLEELLDSFSEAAAPVGDKQKEQEKACPACRRTYLDFREDGKIGCGECYETFTDQLDKLLRRVQRDSQHIGKVPLRGGKEIKHQINLRQLREALTAAVKQEDFEEAARLRDRIREFESPNGTSE